MHDIYSECKVGLGMLVLPWQFGHGLSSPVAPTCPSQKHREACMRRPDVNMYSVYFYVMTIKSNVVTMTTPRPGSIFIISINNKRIFVFITYSCQVDFPRNSALCEQQTLQ